jgi:predicted transcriptional regulator
MTRRIAGQRKAAVKVTPELIQKIRVMLDAGQSQDEVARWLGVSQATVSRYAKSEACSTTETPRCTTCDP